MANEPHIRHERHREQQMPTLSATRRERCLWIILRLPPHLPVPLAALAASRDEDALARAFELADGLVRLRTRDQTIRRQRDDRVGPSGAARPVVAIGATPSVYARAATEMAEGVEALGALQVDRSTRTARATSRTLRCPPNRADAARTAADEELGTVKEERLEIVGVGLECGGVAAPRARPGSEPSVPC